LGAVAQFDKSMTVSKLRGARDRKRRQNGKCEGRKSILERNPLIVQAAQALDGPHISLRTIAAGLAEQGFLSERGTPFSPGVVAGMLKATIKT
jgi:hypothetical protein